MLITPQSELHIGCTEKSKARQKARIEIEHATANFLSSGKKITSVPSNIFGFKGGPIGHRIVDSEAPLGRSKTKKASN